jgi:hypothetical protein
MSNQFHLFVPFLYMWYVCSIGHSRRKDGPAELYSARHEGLRLSAPEYCDKIPTSVALSGHGTESQLVR